VNEDRPSTSWLSYVNICFLEGSRYIVEKVALGYDVLLFQETKLKEGTTFRLEGFIFPEDGISLGLAVAFREDSGVSLEILDSSMYNNPDRQVQLIKVAHPRLSEPVYLANLYI